jgi:hypothetical protein
VKEEILDELDGFEENARDLVRTFEYHADTSRNPRVFRFADAWGWKLKDYSIGFLWCCYAIPWGISVYDNAKAATGQAIHP